MSSIRRSRDHPEGKIFTVHVKTVSSTGTGSSSCSSSSSSSFNSKLKRRRNFTKKNKMLCFNQNLKTDNNYGENSTHFNNTNSRSISRSNSRSNSNSESTVGKIKKNSIGNVMLTWRSENDLERALKPLLWFGKFILLIPILRFRSSIIVFPFLMLVFIIEIVGLFLSDTKRTSPFDVAAAAGSPMFFFIGFYIYYYLHRNYDALAKILRTWKGNSSTTSYTDEMRDVKLYRDVNFWSGLIFTSAILENAVFHFKLCPVSSIGAPSSGNSSEEGGFLKCMYEKMYAKTAFFIPHHDLFSLSLIIANKFALYAWNFSDLLIMSLSRALTFRFRKLGEKSDSNTIWSKLRPQYNELLEIYESIESFLSPLIFACYGINMYALCMQLNLWLTPSKNRTKIESLYSIWSSVHLLLRVYLASIHAAKFHEHAHAIVKLCKDCPPRYYTLEIQRLEDMLCSQRIALSGLKSFYLTKSFILSIISVVFTFEVVLLQSFDVPAAGQNTCP